jgi:hypothetical protein
MKAKRSTRKREHSLNDKSENYSVIGNENRVYLLQKKHVGSKHLLQKTKQKKTESKNKDAPRKTHSI